jgi:hypothetical protein
MKLMMALSMSRSVQDGCQDSGWYAEIDRQIFLLISKRPLGVRKRIWGGLYG